MIIMQLDYYYYIISHNPYFSRRFFAMVYFPKFHLQVLFGHNPYFSRRFFAIFNISAQTYDLTVVTILILVEGSLQFDGVVPIRLPQKMSQSLF